MGEQGVKTLMIAGGGTGGHIYPAIAIAREAIARDANRRVVFVGTEYGLEKTIVPKAGFPLEFIQVGGLKGKGGLDLIRNLARLPLGFIQAFRLIGKHKPDVVLGVGGYSSGPVLIAAVLRRVPTIIHEANAFPGLANRGVSRFVTAVAVAFADALPRLGRSKDGVVTGNPIRAEFFNHQPPAANGRPRLLIFGGSQGSRVINNAILAALPLLEPTFEIVHQTGPTDHEKVAAAYRETKFANARVVPYLDPMVDELAAADLVVCRAGAMTLGELAAVGKAAILIPFAAATNNHQEVNARVVEQAGGAIVLTEKELTAERLASAIGEVFGDPQRAARMSAAAKALALPDATKKIVDLIVEIERN
ncbi:MAG TPA: undecaprenyldiphospho-muramoylpentapeptide beta-N-acetylglucosaminyltransferase [Thermoanaerobaculia bacterium]|nr:undecaprenyldiphospho-muramoylpentapeptide beta-N-acetylglucosaminyltransferase [Thermoanaerobaculia bacterium]